MGIEAVPPQIKLVCDECGEPSGSEEFGGWFTYDADDEAKALHDAIFHRLDDGRIVCDGCAYELHRAVEPQASGADKPGAGGTGAET